MTLAANLAFPASCVTKDRFGSNIVIVMPTAVELVTFEDLERMPDEPGKTELLDGELIQMPPAILPHNILSENLFLRLRRMVDALRAGRAARGLGKVHFEIGYKLGGDPDSWLIPDVSVAHRDQPGVRYYEGAPPIAVEVVSESNTAGKIDRKIEKYLANGRQEAWVVYRKTRRVLTHFAGRDEVEIGRAYIRSRALPEVKSIRLSEIW
jgi:Uma2 family endonuclease